MENRNRSIRKVLLFISPVIGFILLWLLLNSGNFNKNPSQGNLSDINSSGEGAFFLPVSSTSTLPNQSGLSPLPSCTDGDILRYNLTTKTWECSVEKDNVWQVDKVNYANLTQPITINADWNNTAYPWNDNEIAALNGGDQGSILYKSASGWTFLSPGNPGQFLTTNGFGANPQWVTNSTTIAGTINNSTLRWDGTNWVGNPNVLSDSSGNFQISGILATGSSNVALTLPSGFINANALTLNGSTLSVASNGLMVANSGITENQLNPSVAGAGLIGGGGTPLAVGAGNGIAVNANDIAVLYGSTANTAVEGNTTLTVAAGTGLSGGGTAILGAGGIINIATVQDISTTASPIFAGLTVGSLNGVLKASNGLLAGSSTTTDLPEGTNLYYTNSRTRTALSAIHPILYDSSTGVISFDNSVLNTGTLNGNQIVYGTLGIVGQTDTVQFYIRGYSLQTNDLQQWQDNNGVVLASVSGNGTLTTPTVMVSGGSGNGYINLPSQSSNPTAPASGLNLFANSTGQLAWKDVNGFVRTLDGSALTASRNYVLPDASGTIALVNSPNAGYVLKTGDTMTGALNIFGSSNVQQLIVKGSVGQTANLQEWQDSTGSVVAAITSSGFAGLGGTTPDSNNVLRIDTTFTDPSTSPSAIRVDPTLMITANNTTGISGLRSNLVVNQNGFNVTGAVRAVNALATASGSSGTVSSLQGVATQVSNIGAGTVSAAYGERIISGNNSGGGSIGTLYGLYVESQTVGGTNYAIFTNSGLNRLGDQLAVVGSQDTQQLIVKGNATQTSNLQEWQDSNGNVLASIDANGNPTFGISSGAIPATVNIKSNVIGTYAQLTANGSGTNTTLITNFKFRATELQAPSLTTAGTNQSLAIAPNGTGSINLTTSGAGAININTTGTSNVAIGNGTGSITLAIGGDATGDIYYRNSGGTLSRLAIGSSGQTLTVASGIPSWVGGTGTGTSGFWTRSGTTLSPSNAGDTISTSGNILATGSGVVGIGTSTFGTNNKLLVNPANTIDNGATAQISTTALGNKGLVIQGSSGQTANLQEWQNNSGTILSSIDSFGRLNLTEASGNSTLMVAPVGTSQVSNTAAYIVGAGSTKGLVVRAGASQIGNLQEWQNASGTALAGVTPIGNFLAANGSASTPSLSFTNDTSTGFYDISSGNLGVTVSGTNWWDFGGNVFSSTNANGPAIYSTNATSTIPTIRPNQLAATGLGATNSGLTLSLIANGTNMANVTSTGFSVGSTNTTSMFNVGANNEFQVNSSGNIVNIGGAAHSISNNAGILAIDSAGTGGINIGTGANAKTITIGNNTGATALNFTSGTGSQTFTSSATTNNAFVFNANSLSSGVGLQVLSTSTALSTGGLANITWNPGSATTSTGDLLALNVGPNGTIGNILDVQNNGSTVFGVSQNQITAALPTQFTSAGDVGIAYDLNFINPTSSFIKSTSSLYIQSGEVFNSSDLTLRTFNSGNIVLDAAGGVTLAQAQPWNLASSTTALNFQSGLLDLDTTNSRVGIGTTSPGSLLTVVGSSGSNLVSQIVAQNTDGNGYGQITLQNNSTGAIALGVGGTTTGVSPSNGFIKSSNGINIMLAGAGTPTHIFTSTGAVGIDTLSPTAFLTVGASTTANAALRLISSAGTNPTTPNSGDLVWNGTNLNFYNGAANIDLLNPTGPGGNGFVQFAPSSAQTTSTSTNSLINIGTTANTSNTLIVANENGAGTPNLMDLQNAGLSAFTVGNSGNITNIGGAAHSISNTAGVLGIDSAGTGGINIGTGANAKTITVGNTTGATALTFNSGTGTQSFNSSVATGTTTSSAFSFNVNSLSTGTGLYLNTGASNTLTSGTLLAIASTSTGLTTGGLESLDWSPGSATTATGDLLALNVGANGTIGNIFNVKNNGSSVFSVSQSQITAALPMQFTSAGDISDAYDLNFTNPTASFVKSSAPLYIQAGETFNSSDLTLRTFNSGNIVMDAAGGVTLAQAQSWNLATSTTALNVQSGLLDIDTTNSRIGIGTTSPTRTLDVVANVNATEAAQITNNNNSAGAGLRVNVANTNSAVDLLRLNNGSDIWAVTNVGNTLMGASIFTTAPVNRLEVSGAVAIGSGNIGVAAPTNGLIVQGNVGFGTSSPIAAFDEQKAITAAGGSAIGVRFQQALTAAANNDVLTGFNVNPSYVNGAFTGVVDQAALINTGAAAAKGLIVKGAASQSGSLQEWQNSSGTALATITSDGRLNIAAGTSGGDALAITSAASGGLALSVTATNGTAQLRAIGTGGGNAQVSLDAQGGGTANINAVTAAAMNFQQAGSTKMTLGSTGILGIGTSTFGTNNRLLVNSANTLDNAASVQVSTTALGNKGLIVQGFSGQTANLQEWQDNNGAVLAFVNSAGLVSSTGLTSSGTITFSSITGCGSGLQTDVSGVVSCLPSDINLKTNINTLSNALDQVMQLRGVSYNWKDITKYGPQQEYGLIAQEVEQVSPDLVFTMGNGTKGVKYEQLTGLLVESIKDSQGEITAIQQALGMTNGATSDVLTMSNIQNYFATTDIPKFSVDNITVNTKLIAQSVEVIGDSTFLGKAQFNDDVDLKGKVSVGSDSAGSAIIPAGQTSISISFSKSYINNPIVTVTPVGLLNNINYGVANITKSGFDIQISNASGSDLQFNWIAVGVDSIPASYPVSYP